MHTINLRRGFDKALRATTDIDLGNERRMLRFETSKRSSGGLSTFATVHQVSEDGRSITHAIGFGIPGMGDFSRLVEQEREWRCTEKNVRTLHERALERVEAITAMAREHYVQQAAKKAAEAGA